MANEQMSEIQNATVEEIAEADALLESIPEVQKPSSQDIRAAYYEKHRNEIMLGLRVLGKNALKRCIMSAAFGELADKDYKPQGQVERNFVNHISQAVQMRAQMVFEEEFKRLMDAYEKEQKDLEKINDLTVSSLSEDAKKDLEERGLDLNNLTDTKGVL